jgi:hypothetical protein
MQFFEEFEPILSNEVNLVDENSINNEESGK